MSDWSAVVLKRTCLASSCGLLGPRVELSPYYGIDLAPVSDVEKARLRRSMRESARRNADLLIRYFETLRATESVEIAYLSALQTTHHEDACARERANTRRRGTLLIFDDLRTT